MNNFRLYVSFYGITSCILFLIGIPFSELLLLLYSVMCFVLMVYECYLYSSIKKIEIKCHNTACPIKDFCGNYHEQAEDTFFIVYDFKNRFCNHFIDKR